VTAMTNTMWNIFEKLIVAQLLNNSLQLWNRFQYYVHKSSLLDSVMSQMHPVHTLPPYCFKDALSYYRPIYTYVVHVVSSLYISCATNAYGCDIKYPFTSFVIYIHFIVLIDIHNPAQVHTHILTCIGLRIYIKYFEAD
jgi:hypothetical protein